MREESKQRGKPAVQGANRLFEKSTPDEFCNFPLVFLETCIFIFKVPEFDLKSKRYRTHRPLIPTRTLPLKTHSSPLPAPALSQTKTTAFQKLSITVLDDALIAKTL